MCRGSTTACSMKTVGSPNAASPSRMQVSTASLRSSTRSTRRIPRPPPPATALTNSGYGMCARRGHQRVGVGRRRDPGQGRHPGGLRRGDGARLVAGQGEHVGARPDEGDAGVGAGLGQPRVLAEEAVAGVDRVGAGPHRDGDDRVGVEVGPHRVPALPDLVGLVGLQPVLGPAVLVGEHRHRPGPELEGRTERPDRDLAAIGDQHLGEHRLSSCRGETWHQPRVRPSQPPAGVRVVSTLPVRGP